MEHKGMDGTDISCLQHHCVLAACEFLAGWIVCRLRNSS